MLPSAIQALAKKPQLCPQKAVARKKRDRIAEIKAMPNVIERPEGMAGQWHTYFGWTGPLTLELGCGKGEYTVALARWYPKQQFIGIDVKGDRMWVGARQALDEGLHNVAFLRSPTENLTDHFARHTVQRVWLTFPDPFPKPSKAKRRMIASRFLSLYEQVLRPGGLVHLKTDFDNYFQFGLETIEAAPNWRCQAYTRDLYRSSLLDELSGIRTYYEDLALRQGASINYGVFEFRPD